jgi:hypothetical protein
MGDGKLVISLLLGAVGGIVIAHVFKTQINTLWSDIPYLNKIKASNYGYEEY